MYSNDTMRSLRDSEIVLCPPGHPEEGSAEVLSGERTFKRYEYTLDAGRAVVLEDITYLTRLRLSQKETHEKLKAVRELLIRQAEMTRSLTDRLEQERYSNKMDSLFNNKLEQLRSQLNLMNSAGEDELSDAHLRRARFLLFICQQRLRFIIQSLGVHPHVPAEMIEGYAAGLIKNGRRIGLDGVFTAASRGSCPPATVETLLECIDTLCLFAFDMPASSFIFRMDAHEAGIALNASLSLEGDNSIIDSRMIPEDLVAGVTALNGRIEQEAEEDGLLTRLFFPVQEALL